MQAKKQDKVKEEEAAIAERQAAEAMAPAVQGLVSSDVLNMNADPDILF